MVNIRPFHITPWLCLLLLLLLSFIAISSPCRAAELPAPNPRLRIETDYTTGVATFYVTVDSIPLGSGVHLGQTDIFGRICFDDPPPPDPPTPGIWGELWAKESITISVTRVSTGSTIWLYSDEMKIDWESQCSTKEYVSGPFHLAAKTPGEYRVDVTVIRSAIDYPNWGVPVGAYNQNVWQSLTLEADMFAAEIKEIGINPVGTQYLVFSARTSRFNGDISDPAYDQPLSSNFVYKYRGNRTWVYQFFGFEVRRIADDVEIWSSGQDPTIPIDVDIPLAEETYTSKPFPIDSKDLKTLYVKVTVFRAIRSYEGLIGWHANTYRTEKSKDLVPDLITDVSVSKSVFDPFADESVTVNYTLTRNADVTVSLAGGNGTRSALFWNGSEYETTRINQDSGSHTVPWRGIIDFPEMSGYFGAGSRSVFMSTGGYYTFTIVGTATDGSGITDTHHMTVKIETSW